MVKLCRLALFAAVVADEAEEDNTMLQIQEHHAEDISNLDLKRATSAGRGFCQMLCDPADCTRSIAGGSGSAECSNFCQEGCDPSLSLSDCYTQLGWGSQKATIQRSLQHRCQVAWADENEMCHEANLNFLTSHYCSTQCVPQVDSNQLKSMCVSSPSVTGFSNNWHTKTCRNWCAPSRLGTACERNGNIQEEICGELDPQFLANGGKLNTRADPSADHHETIWHGNPQSCPSGYSWRVGEPTKLHSYVPRDQAFELCSRDESGPGNTNDCCGVSETSWTTQGGDASSAHWLTGDMRRLGRCPTTGSFMRNDNGVMRSWVYPDRTWQGSDASSWVSCQPDTQWTNSMAALDAAFGANGQTYNGPRGN